MDANYVTTRLATGAMPGSLSDGQALHDAGIRVVVSACELDSGPFVTPFGIEYLHNPTGDDGTHKDVEWFRRILDFVLPKLVIPKTNIYLHCGAGVNRGPSSLYAVMRAIGYYPDEAKQLIRSKRHALNGGGIAYANDADEAIRVLGYSQV